MNSVELIQLSDKPLLKKLALPLFAKVNLDSILENYFRLGPVPNVVLNAFVSGKPMPILREELHDWRSLKKSFRITNVHLLHPDLQTFTRTVFEETGHVLSGNLYYTPNKDLQGFEMHSDPQNSLVYQIQGQKNWTFLKTGNEYVIEKNETFKVLKQYQSGNHDWSEDTVAIHQGECLVFPYGFLHCVRNPVMESSVHVTFAWERPTLGDFLQFLMEEISPGCSQNYFQIISVQEFKQGLQNLKGPMIQKYLEHFQQMEQVRLGEGRPYNA